MEVRRISCHRKIDLVITQMKCISSVFVLWLMNLFFGRLWFEPRHDTAGMLIRINPGYRVERGVAIKVVQ